ncbi:hypothetical protein [Stenotrophomonas maltophilia]|uniref:hypothetical protein n=1 Tax=Stenotrophomonas maltophilia TaxID=40324 RepID=UPI00387622E5
MGLDIIVAVMLNVSPWLPGWPLALQPPEDLRPTKAEAPAAMLTPAPVPQVAIPPLARLPPGQDLPSLQRDRTSLIAPPPPRPVLQPCPTLADARPGTVVREGRAVPEGVAFPALHATPPKLWQNGRCAGEGMR